MRKIAIFLVLIVPVWFLVSCGEPEWPEGLPHGELILPNFEDPDNPGAYFDFSTGELVFGEEGRQRGDIYLDKTFIAGNPGLGVSLHDQQPDSLLYDSTAPGWGSSGWNVPPDSSTPARISIYDGHNIWVNTSEGHTAKFKILLVNPNFDNTDYLSIKIRWIYQPDGSEEFHPIASPEGEETSSD